MFWNVLASIPSTIDERPKKSKTNSIKQLKNTMKNAATKSLNRLASKFDYL